MKRIQDSAPGKLIAWMLLFCAVFMGASCGLKALQAAPYLSGESYQDTGQFRNLLREYQNQIAESFALDQELEQADLTYVERQQIMERMQQLEQSLDPSATNFRFVVRSAGGEVVTSNLEEGTILANQVQEINYAFFILGEFCTSDAGEAYAAESSIPPSLSENTTSPGKTYQEKTVYTVECGVPSMDQLGTVQDDFAQISYRYYQANYCFSQWLIIAGVCLAAAAAALFFILWAAGHKAGVEQIVPTWQEAIFFDLYLMVMVIAGTALFALGWYLLECFYSYVVGRPQLEPEYGWLSAAVAAVCVLFAAVIALTLRTLAVRLKAHTLARTTLLCRVLVWLWRRLVQAGRWVLELIRSLPFLWKTVADFLAYFLCNTVLFNEARYNALAGAVWWLLNLAVLLLLCWWAMGFRKLRRGSQAIAAGNLSHQIDTHHMPHDLRCHAEDLNNISQGMAEAVGEQMKSERFKAELITNVSHDLKTPLTSIINYVDLLKTTGQTDPKALEYIEVLDRKSQRLKKLTEDLVEASKASTGVLSVNREKIGMAQLIDQALGEWTEKLEDRKLTVVTALPEGETWVYADGRHLWRVIDNLLSNCAKYAMEGTRVYLDLNRGHGQVTLSVKNISREPLNVPPEQLMERFVRGEESRTTEGSGLGLSIARSLTELQGGTFDLTVDGDLFKAIVSLPQAN